jgi:hypothetical protein
VSHVGPTVERGQQLADEPACACEQSSGYCARCYARVEREAAEAKLEHWLATWGNTPSRRPARAMIPVLALWSRAE